MGTHTHFSARRSIILTLLAFIGALLLATLDSTMRQAIATEATIVIPSRQEAARVNTDTIGVVFTHEELFHQLVHDMEDALEPVSGLRIVPVMGKNHVQSIYDLLYLKGVDLALVRADAVEYVKRKGDYGRIERFVNSVAKLTEERLVVIAGKDIESLQDLDGEIVAFGVPGSGEFVTGAIAFDTLGIEVDAIEMDGVSALDEVRDGLISAMVYLLRAEDSIQTGSDLLTAQAVAQIDADDELHIIPIPANDAMSEVYHSTELNHQDLPGLIPEGETVESYLVDVILAGYRWKADNPRYDKSVRFVNALLDSLESLQSEDFQPGWSEVGLPQSQPTVEPLPVVASILKEREELAAQQADQMKAEQENAALEERQQQAAKIVAAREQLSTALDRSLDEDKIDELERILDELSQILDETETESN